MGRVGRLLDEHRDGLGRFREVVYASIVGPRRDGGEASGYRLRLLDEGEAAAVGEWTATATTGRAGTVTITFPDARCPSCRDDARVPPWSPRRVPLTSLGVAPGTVQHDEQVTMRCRCESTGHANRPEGVSVGCGAVWNVRFRWSADSVTDLRAGPRPSSADLALDGRVAALQAAELGAVRSQAVNWSKVLAGLAGLAGASQLFAGRSFGNTLTPGWQDAIGVALLATLLLAITSSVVAGRAAFGKIGATTTLRDTLAAGGEAAALDRVVDDQIADVRRLMKWAAGLAALALAGGIFIGAAVWWAPLKPSPKQSICVQSGTEVVHLGSLPEVTSGSITVVACESAAP